MKAAAKRILAVGHETVYLYAFEHNVQAMRFYERLGGVQQECIRKDIFGYEVLSRKIVWDNVRTIVASQ
jgi:RimJ/RimL family protein N-acetyltransferase